MDSLCNQIVCSIHAFRGILYHLSSWITALIGDASDKRIGLQLKFGDSYSYKRKDGSEIVTKLSDHL